MTPVHPFLWPAYAWMFWTHVGTVACGAMWAAPVPMEKNANGR